MYQDGFEKEYQKTKLQTIFSSSQFQNVTVKASIAKLWTVLFPIKRLSISFPTHGSIKLVIINMTYPFKESYPLS